MKDTRAQIAKQCKAISHMARAIAQVHDDYSSLFETRGLEGCEDIVGRRTASFMEQLGDMLNAMDATTPEDDWLTPIFEEAQKRWSRSKPS